jgi:hypothetical protein
MATTQETPPPRTDLTAWDALGRLERQTAISLLVLAALFSLIPILVGIKYRGDYLAVCLWGGALALVALLGSLWRFFAHPARLSPADSTRLLVLVVGGLSGLLTVAFLGLGLAIKWWSTVTGGWEAWQGKEGWHIWVILLAFVGGLALMFVSLQLARADERSNSAFRRLLYGYNAVLTGLLLLLILVVVNVLVYIPWGPFGWFNQTFNWSESSIYSLTSKSENVLDALDKPVKIYVFLTMNDEAYRPTRALMDNVRAVNKGIQVKYLNPDSDHEEIERLAKDYKVAIERKGMLVVYGRDPDIETRFIKESDLFSSEPDMMTGRTKQSFFKGESALISELNSLEQGKEKPVIYLTQGNGELDMNDSRLETRFDHGLAKFKERLQGSNYIVKGLQFSAVDVASKKPDLVLSKKVPSDATMVIIAGPRRRFEPFALDALREYMNPTDPKAAKGKLIVMLGVVISPEKTMLQTGLEPLLAEFDVDIKNDRLLRVPTRAPRDPELVLVEAAGDSTSGGQNSLLAAFRDVGFFLPECRPVKAKLPTGTGPQTFRVEPLLEAFPNQGLLQDSGLAADPSQLLMDLIKSDKLGDKLSQEPVPVAVTVSESPGTTPGDPHAFMKQRQEAKPRLVVFGNGLIACNALMSENTARGVFYDLIASTIGWLREKPGSIGIEPKKSDFYVLKGDVNVGRIVWLPALLMIVTIVGLGAGVWVVRRR